MTARQVIADAAGVRRRYPTGAHAFTSVPSRGGDYWKFVQAARFELWTELPNGARGSLVRIGPKLRYCLRDRRHLLDLPGSPGRRVFGTCNQTPEKQEVTLGTSVGWADVYPASYPGNVIDVTGLSGCFVVMHRVDPDHHILEISEANNVATKVVRLPFRPGRQRCPLYAS